MTASFANDKNGQMASRTVNGKTYAQVFDKGGRLTSVTVNGLTTNFYYDADGNRILTKQSNGTLIYTPFPELERTVPTSGAVTDRYNYFVAGQHIGTRVQVQNQTGVFYYVFTDRQGSVMAMRQANGTWVNNNYAHYDAFGGYRTQPDHTVNPGISDFGYTG